MMLHGKLLRRILIALTWLTVLWLADSAVMAATPHEDPATAVEEFSGVALFRYYSASLDFVLQRAPGVVEARLTKMPFANVPPDLKGATNDFSSSSTGVAYFVVALDEDLSELETLVGQSRFSEALQSAQEISARLSQANREVEKIREAMLATGRGLNVSSAPERSYLRTSYDEVLERIDKIKGVLASDKDMLVSLQEAARRGEQLKPADITLEVEPRIAFVGDEIRFEGSLTTKGEPLAGREVDILLNGSRYVTVKTDISGQYQGTLQVPGRYVTELNLQALYYPRGQDFGFYLSSLSSMIKLKVLFYEARFKMGVGDKVYPGREITLTGQFDYGQSPPLKERAVEVYLDNVFLTEVRLPVAFSQKISLAPALALGEHSIALSAVGAGRYAPVVASTRLEVTRATPILDISLPKMVVIPGSFALNGKLYSEVGSLSEASISLRLGTSQFELSSSEEGAFDTKIRVLMALGLIGRQTLVVEVVPREPWHRPISTTASLLVVNVINSGLFLVLLLSLGLYLPRRLARRLGVYRQRRARPAVVAALSEAVPTYSERATVLALSEEGDGLTGEPRSRIFYWYRLVVKLLLGMTRALVTPQQTLREFAAESSRILGPAAHYFIELTSIVERLLYSPYRASEEDVGQSQQLSRAIEEKVKGENV